MARTTIDPTINFIIHPTPGWYQTHVRLRIDICVNLTLRVWKYHAWARSQATQANRTGPPPMSSCIATKAEAQAGVGNYGIHVPVGKLDAAHLMNTTIRSKVLAQGQPLTQNQMDALVELTTASAATTTQLKRDNVGPDKVIDTCMTAFTQACADAEDHGIAPPPAAVLVQKLGKACWQALSASANFSNPNYQAAMEAVKEAMSQDPWAIDYDVQEWTRTHGFV